MKVSVDRVVPGAMFRHVKTGGEYVVITQAVMEADAETIVVVYTSVYPDATDLLRRWVRPLAEFCDGRFVECPAGWSIGSVSTLLGEEAGL